MNFKITANPTTQDKEEIFNELLKYNLQHLECKDVKELGIFLEDVAGKKVAGLIGETHGNWLEVEFLWVDESIRGQDIGTKLMDQAEQTARERGCKYVFLNTFGFQAKGFYLKRGYQEVFCLEEYPLTGKRHYLVKVLD